VPPGRAISIVKDFSRPRQALIPSLDNLIVSRWHTGGISNQAFQMTNVASALKSEIVRLSRKTVKGDLSALRSANASQRKQISELKAQMLALQRTVGRMQKALPTKTPEVSGTRDSEKPPRFSANTLRSHRAKLGLSAQDYAKLAGVSALSIYKWESNKAHPRNAQIQALADVRKLGKKAALAKLEASTD